MCTPQSKPSSKHPQRRPADTSPESDNASAPPNTFSSIPSLFSSGHSAHRGGRHCNRHLLLCHAFLQIYSKPPIVGKTKCVDLGGLIFQMASNTIVKHTDPTLLTIAEFVTVAFVDQIMGIRWTPEPNAGQTTIMCAR
jgi:hypothetical protein